MRAGALDVIEIELSVRFVVRGAVEGKGFTTTDILVVLEEEEEMEEEEGGGGGGGRETMALVIMAVTL